LKARRTAEDAERVRAGEFWEESDLLFATSVGTPISPRNDYREFRRLLDAANIRRVRLHDLRHTAASLMVPQAVNPRVVMEVLGHSQISITMNTYSHVAPAVSRAAVRDIAALLIV
jgi:integrase